MVAGPVADERLASLRRAKLRALVRDGLAVDVGGLVDGPLRGGATLTEPGGDGGWVLVDDGALAGLGAALAWAQRHGRGRVDVLLDGPAGVAARAAGRAAAFAHPATAVWRVDGRTLTPAEPSPGGAEAPGEVPPGELADLLAAHGVDPVAEGGVLRGEVLGLEVARAERAPLEEGGGWRLAVGVGRHDREARAELRPGQDVGAALDEVVAVVRAHRVADAPRHPANLLAWERWLRAVLVAHPELAGAAGLTPVASLSRPDDLRQAAPAAALGTGLAGGELLVVASTGIDLDLVPTAVELRAVHAPGAQLVVVVPEGDDHPITRALAAQLRQPAEVRTVPRGWAALL